MFNKFPLRGHILYGRLHVWNKFPRAIIYTFRPLFAIMPSKNGVSNGRSPLKSDILYFKQKLPVRGNADRTPTVHLTLPGRCHFTLDDIFLPPAVLRTFFVIVTKAWLVSAYPRDCSNISIFAYNNFHWLKQNWTRVSKASLNSCAGKSKSDK